MDPVILDGSTLRCEDLAEVGAGRPVALDPAARARLEVGAAAWAALGPPDILARKERWLVGVEGPEVGEQERVRAFVLGHCSGVGPPLPEVQVRALLLGRASALAAGASGVRPEVVELLLAMLNAGVSPVVPSQGSVGAAGDLAPLAHLAQVALRYGGRAWRGGALRPGAEAMEGLPTLLPTPKEALSLINGATLTAALGALAVVRAERLLRSAERTLAMTMEVVLADTGCLDERALLARRHPGAVASAARVRAHLQGSVLARARGGADAFSIRCAPAVMGAAWEALEHTREVVERELAGACDNPLVLEGELLEAGNFHGAPVALALDHLKAALTQVASLTERRVYRLTYGRLSGHLPSFLVAGSGVDSGFMLAQYTAASLVSECKGLAFPSSVDSIPTAQHSEDHVSMGPIAARTCLRITEALADVVGVEALVAAQGLDFRREGRSFAVDGAALPGEPTPLAPAVAEALALVRARVPFWEHDRVLHRDLHAVAALVREGALAGEEGADIPRSPW